jgi:hypothetical protein
MSCSGHVDRQVALNCPYTFIVLALLILILSPVVILRTPTDIFPNINIPVIAVAWQFTGLHPEEMEGRITTQYARVLTKTVDNIEHLESTTVNGQSMIKIYLQPNARLDTVNAQVTAVSQTILRQLPAGTQPPLVINYSASTVPILQLALSGLQIRAQRRRPELPAHPARDRARRFHSLSVWRQAAPGDGRSGPGAASVEGTRPRRCRDRPRCADHRAPLGHREDRPVRVRRSHEREPAHGGQEARPPRPTSRPRASVSGPKWPSTISS